MSSHTSIIFFDGICNLCNTSIQYILKRDTKNYFKFSSLQSDFAKSFFAKHQYLPKSNSIILFDSGKFYDQSTAVFKISAKLKFPTNVLSIGIVFPKFLRDIAYNWISKNRYNWFGKRDTCMLPTKAFQEKFIDN